MKYRLVAIDLDGTLLNEHDEISDENFRALQEAKARGVEICIATGRPYRYTIPYVKDLMLTGPLVTANGGEIWKTPSSVFSRTFLNNEDITWFRKISEKEGLWFWAYSAEESYHKDNWPEQALPQDWLKFGFQGTREALERVKKMLAEHTRFEITNSAMDNLEINPKGVSKASALKEIIKWRAFLPSQIAVIGDSFNDLEMIKWAGLGAAMGNAQDEIKQASDIVVSDNRHSGVAQLIYEHILI